MRSHSLLHPGRRAALAAIPLAGLLAGGVAVVDAASAERSSAAGAEAVEVKAAGLDVQAALPASDYNLTVPAPRVVVRHVFVDRDGSPLPVLPEPEPEPTPEPEAAPAPERDEDPAPEPEVEPEPEPEPEPEAPTGRAVWDDIAACESGGDWSISVGTFEGGVQFHPDTWDAFKDSGMPDAAYQASKSEQIRIAERVLDAQGWGAWPACSSKLGLR